MGAPYGHCGRLHGPICYQVPPNKVPEWWREANASQNGQGKRKRDTADTGMAFQYLKYLYLGLGLLEALQ